MFSTFYFTLLLDRYILSNKPDTINNNLMSIVLRRKRFINNMSTKLLIGLTVVVLVSIYYGLSSYVTSSTESSSNPGLTFTLIIAAVVLSSMAVQYQQRQLKQHVITEWNKLKAEQRGNTT